VLGVECVSGSSMFVTINIDVPIVTRTWKLRGSREEAMLVTYVCGGLVLMVIATIVVIILER
jgi:hypothetical protein